MRAALRRLLRLAALTDREAQCAQGVFTTRCLHCRQHLQCRDDGNALGATSLEHVIPRAWFGQSGAADLTARVGHAPDDPRNLALACAGCNQGKGTRHDARGPLDARARSVVTALLDRRLARWRDPPPGDTAPSDRHPPRRRR